MITIYDKNATDFTTNGLGTIDPISCTVKAGKNSNLGECTLVHLIDEKGKFKKIEVGNILRVPVPAAYTPAVKYAGQTQTSTEIWAVNTSGIRLYLRSEPRQDSKGIHAYRPGTEVVVISKDNAQWYEVTTPDGTHGYMWAGNLRYVRTETSGSAAEESIIEPKTVRDQPMRIYKVVPELTKITVYARHIFYDLMDNLITEYKPAATETGASVAQGILTHCMDTGHGFAMHSDLDSTAEGVEFINKNPVDAIMGDHGLLDKYGGEIYCDWYDIYIVKKIGQNSGMSIREGKNLTGINYDVDETNVATRFVPVGKDKDGNVMYLPEVYIDSQLIESYPHVKIGLLDVKEAKVVEKGENKKTQEECFALMRQAVQDAIDGGADQPAVTLKVNFVNLSETEEYKQYGFIQGIYLGDEVNVRAMRVGVDVTLRLTEYGYNCLTRRYESAVLGTAEDKMSTNIISPKQIGNGTLSGMKLVPSSVGTEALANGAVTGIKVALAAIDYANINEATIGKLKTDSIEAQIAHINELTAEKIDTDELTAAYAHLFELVAGKITAGEITADTLTAAMAKLNSASIKSADIDYTQIKDAVVQSLITRDAVADRYFIDKLQVRNLQVLDQTVGNLVIKAADGKYYRLDIDTANATVTPVQVTPTQSEINAGVTSTQRSIIETSMLVSDLSATNIKGINAIIDKITASRITVDTLFARQATIDALNAYIIKASTIEAIENSLQVWAQEQITLGIGSKIVNPNLLAGTEKTVNVGRIQNSASNTGAGTESSEYGDAYPDKWQRITDNDATHTWWRKYFNASDHLALTVGQVYTFSADVKLYAAGDTAEGTGNKIRIGSSSSFSKWFGSTDLPWGETRRISHTFTATSTGPWLMIDCQRGTRSGSYNYFDIRKIKLEVGSIATEWHPIDFINSALIIDDKGVRMTGGALEFSAGTMFKVNSGGAVQIDASSAEDSYINLGNGNFSASKQGGVTGDTGNFTKLFAGGKPVLTGDNLPMPVIVSKNNPGKRGVVWLQPSSLSSVDYTNAGFTSRKEANDFGITHTISATFAAVNSDTLPNGTLKYHLEIPLYSLSASIDDMSIAVKLTKGSSSVTMTRVNNIVIRPYNEVIAVCEFTSTTNLCSNANAITVEMTGTRAGATMTEHVYIQKDRALKLTVSTSGSGSAQACNVYYLP